MCYRVQSISIKITYNFISLIWTHTVVFQTNCNFVIAGLNKIIHQIAKTSLKPLFLQHLFPSLTVSKDSGSKVLSPAVVTHALTHCFSTRGRQSGQAIEQDLPCTLLGDNPAGQVVDKTGAQWNYEKCYGAPVMQHQRHLLQGQPHCNQSSPLRRER